jgi:kynureninase
MKTERSHAEALDQADPLAGFRARFVLDDRSDEIYVDGNSLGRLPKSTAERLDARVREWGARLVTAWPDWIDLPSRVGDELGAAALGAGPGQVLMTDSTTVNLYKLASAALDARPERRTIVFDPGDFPTDRYVLEGLAATRGLERRPLGAGPLSDAALVCLSHVNYRSGELVDMEAVTRAAHEGGALALWDLSHSAGVVPVELDAAGADLAVGCTYKYLSGGPGSVAFLYVRRELQEQLRSPVWGWFGQREQFAMGPGYDPLPGIERFHAGTPPILSIDAAAAGIQLVAAAGIEAVRAKSTALTTLADGLYDEWLAPLGFELETPREPERRGGHVSFRHPDGWPICRALAVRANVVADFRAPDSIRFGFPPLYTRFVDVWDALDRLRRLVLAREHVAFESKPARVT